VGYRGLTRSMRAYAPFTEDVRGSGAEGYAELAGRGWDFDALALSCSSSGRSHANAVDRAAGEGFGLM
jgi:hypothetical protein